MENAVESRSSDRPGGDVDPPDGAVTASNERVERSGRPYLAAVVAAALGLVAAGATALVALPVFALGVGAVVALPVAWRLRGDYATAASLVVLGLGVVVAGLELGAPYDGWTGPVLLVLGGVSTLFILGKLAVKAGLKALASRYLPGSLVAELWDIGATLASVLYVVWNVVRISSQALRGAAVAVAAPSTVALNAYMTVADAVSVVLVDVTVAVFAAAFLLGAHTLGSWNRTLALVRR